MDATLLVLQYPMWVLAIILSNVSKAKKYKINMNPIKLSSFRVLSQNRSTTSTIRQQKYHQLIPAKGTITKKNLWFLIYNKSTKIQSIKLL